MQQRWREGRNVVKRDEGRQLTQREFLDVAFGNNPRTGKPYNPRTLRKWLKGERNASAAVEHSTRDTFSFQQRVQIGDETYAPTLTKPSGRSGLDLFTPSGRKRIRRAAKERLQDRADKNLEEGKTAPITKAHKDRKTGQTTIEIYRPVTNTRGLKLARARAVSKGRAGTIITRKAA